MIQKFEVDRLHGLGEVRLPDGIVVPSGYDVRVLETRQKIVTNQGEEWLPTGLKSFSVTLQHGGKLHAPPDSSGNLFLVMEDGRRLELLLKRYNPQHGVTEVIATGGILPAN